MRTLPSKDRAREFIEPKDLPQGESRFSFFVNKSEAKQLSQFHDYLRSYPPRLWAKLLKLLKQEPTLMKGRSIRPLLRLSQSLCWIPRLFPNKVFDQIAYELPTLLHKVDRDALSRLFLASLVVNPHDGKADNYMVTINWRGEAIESLRIIGIDNDLAFQAPVMQAGGNHYIQTKCLLYALPPGLLRSSVPMKVRKDLCQRPLEELTLQWITQLDKRDQIYSKLRRVQKLCLELPEQALATAIGKLRKIQHLLQRDITLEEIFREVEPVVFHAYQEASRRATKGGDALALLDWRHGLPLESVLVRSFATVELNGEAISLKQTYQKLAARPSQKARLPAATQAVVHELALTNTHLQSLADLSFIDQLKIPLQSPQKLLVRSIKSRNFSLIRLALLHGADANQCDEAGCHPLYYLFPFSQAESSEKILNCLVAAGADVEWKDPETGQTLLDFTANFRFVREFMALILNGAGRDAQAAQVLAFAHSSLEEVGMQEALKRLEKQCLRVAWLQDLAAILIDRSESRCLPLQRACLKSAVQQIEITKTYLHPSVAKQIGITSENRFSPKKKNQYGRHVTVSITHQGRRITFKNQPEMAGNEYLVGSLHRRLVGHGTPETELFKAKDSVSKAYPVLASQTVPGPNLRDVLYGSSHKLVSLDRHRLHNMILMAILTNPEDGKPENYIFSPLGENSYQLFCVDNDHSFVRPFDGSQLMVKCVLFCLDQMQQNIDPRTRKLFLDLDPGGTLQSWLNECSDQNRLYTALFSDPERQSQLDSSQRDPLIIQMFLPKRTTAKLFEKIGRIQEALQDERVTPLDLLVYTTPELGRYYQQLFSPGYSTPVERWQNVKEIGGYLTDSSGGDRTRTSTLDLLKHFHIEPQKLLKLNPSYFIEQAQAELIHIKTEKEQTSAITRDLLKGDSKRFQELLLDHSRERALRGYPFGQSPRRDLTVLSAMLRIKASFFHLNFSRAQSFFLRRSWAQLGQVLTFSPFLKSLKLDRCQDVSGGFLWSIAGLCSHLRRLSMVECSEVKDVWARASWLTFPSLQRLSLRGSGLQRFHIRAPKLTSLDLSLCK